MHCVRARRGYREMFENANDLIYTADLKGQFTSLNRAGELITKYSREEIIGCSVDTLIAPEDLEKANEMSRRKLATHQPTTYEIHIIAKGGPPVPVEVGSRLVYEKGEPVRSKAWFAISPNENERKSSCSLRKRQLIRLKMKPTRRAEPRASLSPI